MNRRLLSSVAAIVAALALVPAGASAWAPAPGAIHPGVQLFTNGAQCTANFIYTEVTTSGTTTFIGQAAHCSGTGSSTDTNGCTSASLPLGTPVTITGADHPGTLVYNSWLTMQAQGEKDPETCQYNDLALVKVDPADVAKINPSVPGFGGPTGTASLGDAGSTVYTYGNSELRGGVQKLSPKQGVSVQRSPGGWSTSVYTVTPGIPGDSGSGFLTDNGQAAGVLSTVAITPLPASNGVGDLPKEIAYMQSHGGPAASVVNGTEPFNGNLVAAIAAAPVS